MKLSKHACIRMQQRGISSLAVDRLAAYGQVDHQRGAELFYFNKKSREALKRDLGNHRLRGHAKTLNAYMVSTGDRIATVGHRYQRVVRHWSDISAF